MSVKQNLTYAEIGFCVCFLIFPLFYDKLSGYFFFWFTNIMSDSWHNSNWIKKLLSLSLNICTCMRSHSDPPSDPATFYQLLIMRILYICMKMLASVCRAAKLKKSSDSWLCSAETYMANIDSGGLVCIKHLSGRWPAVIPPTWTVHDPHRVHLQFNTRKWHLFTWLMYLYLMTPVLELK